MGHESWVKYMLLNFKATATNGINTIRRVTKNASEGIRELNKKDIKITKTCLFVRKWFNSQTLT